MDKIKLNIGGTIVDVDKELVSSGIEAGEIKIENDSIALVNKEDHVVYSKDEFSTFTGNLKKTSYDEGKIAQEEMLVKAAKERNALSFEGKSFEKYEESLKAKIIEDAKIEPNQKVQTLESDLAKLQRNYNSLTDDFDAYKNDITTKETRSKKDNLLMSLMPDNLLVDKETSLIALKKRTGIDVDFSETGKPLQLVNGEIQKDKSLEPMQIDKDFIKSNLETLGLLKIKEGGRGELDETKGGAGSYTAFIKEMETNGVNQGSEKFQVELNKRISSKTIDMSK